jgi:biotin carboxylase
MDVVFLSPHYPAEMPQFTRGLAEVGARVFGIGDAPVGALPDAVKTHLHAYLEVPRIMDEDDVMARASAWLAGRSVDRVLANWEPLVMLAARLRERWGVPGMFVDAVRGFRDKQLMKERVAAAGLRVPRSARATTAAQARAAAAAIGFPLVIKPIDGAGSADTHRVDDVAGLEEVLPQLRQVSEVSVEEYIVGEEFTYDAISVAGVPVFENVVQYFPKPIEGRSEEWISPAQITVRDLTQPHIVAGLELGRAVLAALRMGDGFSHMEWFLTPGGEAVFGEIACRAGGAKLVDQMNWTCDADLFREWARVSCYGVFKGPTERKYNVAVVFKRAKGRGRVTRIEGLDAFLRDHGQWVVEEHLSRPGTPRRDWKATLLSDGHLVLRHPDWEEARRLTAEATTRIHLYAQ